VPLTTSLITRSCSLHSARIDPYWGYEDIGIFFLFMTLIATVFRLAVRLHLLRTLQLVNPEPGLQCVIVVFLLLALYLVLKLRYRRKVVESLGWVLPTLRYTVAALLIGPIFALGVTLSIRSAHPAISSRPKIDFLVLALLLGPVLEESLLRGCILPVLARTFGSALAVTATAFLFALLHGPASLTHWIWFTTTGIAYGWLRLASHTTTAAFFMHASYNLALLLLAAA
jgi:membrane protease YdiL (CAAX protease family)